MGAGRGDVADVELERFEATEHPARQASDDVEPVAFVDGLGDIGPAEGDAIEHVPFATKGQLAMAAAGGSNTSHGKPEDGDEGIGVPGAAWGESRQLTMERVVHVPGR